MSSMLKKKHALAKLRVELEGRRGKICRRCKGFGHLAQNCRNRKGERKGMVMPQNKFEVLSSRVMQCGVEEKTIRNIRMAEVKCFKYGEEGHKCRWCPLWKGEKRVAYPSEGKVHQGEVRKPVRPQRGKAQECNEKKEVRRVEKRVAYPVKREAQQEEWKRSSWEVLKKRAKWCCGPTVPQDAELWELGWQGQGAVVTYLKCPRYGKGECYVEDDQGQGVVPHWKREKMSWCRCKGKRE